MPRFPIIPCFPHNFPSPIAIYSKSLREYRPLSAQPSAVDLTDALSYSKRARVSSIRAAAVTKRDEFSSESDARTRECSKFNKILLSKENSPKLHRDISKLPDLYQTTAEYLDQTADFPHHTTKKQGKGHKKRLPKHWLSCKQPLGHPDANRQIYHRPEQERIRDVKGVRQATNNIPGSTIPAVDAEEEMKPQRV